MKWKKMVTGLLFTTCLFNTNAQDTIMYLSLKQTCQAGIEKNVNVQNASLETKKSRFKLKEVQSMLYPKIEAYSNFSYYFAIPKMIVPGEIFGQTGLIPIEIGTKYDWNSGFKASIVLYNQSYFTSLKLAKQMETLSSLSEQQQKEEVVYQISQVYFLCQNTSKQIELMSKTHVNTEQLLRISKLQNENGIIRKIDHSRILVNKSNLQTQIDNLNQLHLQQLGLLKYLIGINQNQKISLTDSINTIVTFFSSDSVEFDERSEIQLLDKQLNIVLLTKKSNMHSFLPTLSGFSQYYLQGQRNKFDFFKGGDDKFYKVGMIGLSLTIPIFDGFEKRSKNKQYMIESMQLQNTRKNTIELFSKQYTDAIEQYNNSYAALLRQKENVKVAEETYNVSLQGYQQHLVPLSDLLLSESSLIEAQLSYYNSLMQLENAQLELKKANGKLLDF